jgi:hypothetical protein
MPDHHERQRLIGNIAGHLEQILPVFFLGMGLDQNVLQFVMHTAQVAHMHCRAIPSAQIPASAPMRPLRAPSAPRSVAAADHQQVEHG